MTLVDLAALNAMRAEREAALAENARLRAAVEDVLGYGYSWIPVDATSDERALCCELIDQFRAAFAEGDAS